MTAPLWHGNDDPPKIGEQIEYIMDGVEFEGEYRTGGYIYRKIGCGDWYQFIDHMNQVSQWRAV